MAFCESQQNGTDKQNEDRMCVTMRRRKICAFFVFTMISFSHELCLHQYVCEWRRALQIHTRTLAKKYNFLNITRGSRSLPFVSSLDVCAPRLYTICYGLMVLKGVSASPTHMSHKIWSERSNRTEKSEHTQKRIKIEINCKFMSSRKNTFFNKNRTPPHK